MATVAVKGLLPLASTLGFVSRRYTDTKSWASCIPVYS